MEDFKKLPKMQAFKTGGSVASEYCGGGRMKKKEGGKIDEAQDKAIIKKAFKQHDKAEHDKSEPTEIKLKKGGRAKKETGTVKKYKAGGKISGEQGKAGHEDGYIKVKPTADKKADAPSKGSEKPNFRASDVEKEKSKPAGHKDPYIKSKQSGKAAATPSGAKGPDAYKKGGEVTNVYEAKKTAGDKDNIKKVKEEKPVKLCGGKSVKKMAEGGSDSVDNDATESVGEEVASAKSAPKPKPSSGSGYDSDPFVKMRKRIFGA
jgi:hypothetical protein